jgi:hypothetical protein
MREMKTVIIRVPIETIEKLREKYPELKNEKNATVVRVALSKLLGEIQ